MAIKDTIAGIKNLAVGMENLELISKLIDLQSKAYEILDENRELRLELEEIKRQDELASDLEYLPDMYYRISDGSGPYCSVCWDTKRLLVNVPIYDVEFLGWLGNCNNCKSSQLRVPKEKIPSR